MAELKCVLCRASGDQVVLDLGAQPSARQWPLPSDPTPDPAYGLAMWVCPGCGLAQLAEDQTTEPEVAVPEPQAVRDQAAQAVADLTRLGWLAGRRTVREFGSPHGGSWLEHLPLEVTDGPADLVVDSLGLMHERDLAAAVEARCEALAGAGALVALVQPLGDIVATGQWTALRHGHYAYFSLTSLRSALSQVGLVPVTALRYDLYGGTAVVVATRDGSPDEELRRAYAVEQAQGLDRPEGVARLAATVSDSLERLRAYLDERRASQTRLYGYGAASRAVAELATLGDAARALTAVADASPAKQGRALPGSRVPVVSPEQLLAADPEEVLVLLPDLVGELLERYPALAGRLVVAGPGGVALPSRQIERWDRSVAWQRRLHELVPAGAHTYARGPDQYPEDACPVLVRGRGAQVWDVDNHSYVEYGIGLRAVTLGHRHPRVDEAVRRAQRDGVNFSRPTRLEAEVAERFLANLPGAQRVKFAKNGSDVTTAAVRLARAVTGRQRLAICDQSFFSVDDWWISHSEMDAGTAPAERDAGTLFAYNDLAAVTEIVERGDVAAVVLQAASTTENPEPGFLEGLRALCDRTGTVLVFDEIITGYRWHVGGVQTLTGVTPDLSCWAKGIGNGYAVSALAGKAELMDLGGLGTDRPRTFLVSTTYGSESVGLAALDAVMSVYASEDPIGRIRAAGERLRDGMNQVVAEAGLSAYLAAEGNPACLMFTTRDAEGSRSQLMRTVFLRELLRHGVLGQSWVTCASHTDALVDHTIEAVRAALPTYRRALEDPGVLVGRPVAPTLRRYAEPRRLPQQNV